MTMAMLTNIDFHGRNTGFSLLFLIRQTTTLIYITLVPAFIITLHGQICNAETPYMCNGHNYTKGSNYERNVNTVLNSLLQHTSQTGFNTSASGQIPEKVYGLLQCSGDTTAQQCYNCSQKAISELRQVCGNAIGGKVWLEACYLRYENGSFLGNLDYGYKYEPNPQNVSSPDIFNTALERLLHNLSGEATSVSRYASGSTEDSLGRKIYGQVQCCKDISTDDCTKCLSYAVTNIVTFYAGNQGVEAFIASCKIRYEIYSFFHSTAEAPANTSVAISPPSSNSTQMNHSGQASNKMPIILGAAGGLALLVLFVCLFACWRRLKSAIFRRLHEGNGQVDKDTLLSDRQIVFKMNTLVIATANFHDDNKIGEGGFGPVYKGTTQDGKQIAVKKLSLKSVQGRKEFLNEVKLVVKIQHRNLVNLLGCCSEGSERLLVYEYLPNKSLDRFIFDTNKRADLDWQKRYNIILGVSRGLLYLHQDSRLRIVHRDIKASNILLDEKLNPKISDFGLAKLFAEEETHVSTRVAGTLGYMAPEYALRGQLTVKADVYSFGVVLLEIVTGRKNTDYNLPSEMEMLVGWVWSSYKRGTIVQTIDPAIMETAIMETYDERQASRCIHVGLLCTQADSSLRPPMSTVTLMLSSHSEALPDPTKPAYVSVTQITNSTGSRSGLSQASAPTPSSVSPSHVPVAFLSNADTSITVLVPR